MTTQAGITGCSGQNLLRYRLAKLGWRAQLKPRGDVSLVAQCDCPWVKPCSRCCNKGSEVSYSLVMKECCEKDKPRICSVSICLCLLPEERREKAPIVSCQPRSQNHLDESQVRNTDSLRGHPLVASPLTSIAEALSSPLHQIRVILDPTQTEPQQPIKHPRPVPKKNIPSLQGDTYQTPRKTASH